MEAAAIIGKRAIVIGAGIGGLCAAIALCGEGWTVTVCEQAADPGAEGAGIVLAPNAMKALARLGAAEAVRAAGAPIGRAEIRAWDGRPIVELPVAAHAARYGTGSYLIHRAALHRLLRERLGGRAAIETGKRLIAVAQNAAKTAAVFADGTMAEADVLIGADGIRSVVREQLFGPAPLRYSGFTALRGVCRWEDARYSSDAGGGFEAWGPGKRFGLSHLGGGRVFWFAAINAPQGTRLPAGARKDEALRRFAGWYEPVRAAIEATAEADMLAHDIYDRKPLAAWSQGRVSLLGDAAHPMLPNLGQGGAQAMEDAVMLARCLRHADSAEGLQRYERARMARTASIVKQSRRMARLTQLDSRLAIYVRNRLLGSLSPEFYLRRLDRVLGYELQG